MTRAADLAELGSAYAGSSPFAFRNKLINGGFDIWQRGTSITAAVGDSYTADRWGATAAGAAVVVSQAKYPEVSGGLSMSALVVAGAANNTQSDIWQRIEGNNARLLANKTVTVSGQAYRTDAGSVTWEVYYANATDNFTAKTLIATGTFSIGSGVYAPFSFNFAAPIGYVQQGIEVRFKFGALAANKQGALALVQVEPGAQATPFEQRPYGLELALCQRYYVTSSQYLNGVPPYPGRGNIDNVSAQAAYTFPTPMRTTPTVTYNCAPQTSGGASYVTIYGFLANSSLNVAGHSNFLGYTANAEL